MLASCCNRWMSIVYRVAGSWYLLAAAVLIMVSLLVFDSYVRVVWSRVILLFTVADLVFWIHLESAHGAQEARVYSRCTP